MSTWKMRALAFAILVVLPLAANAEIPQGAVRIRNYRENGTSHSSGAVVGISDDDVYVLACAHGVKSDDVEIELFPGKYRSSVSVLARDESADLSLLRIRRVSTTPHIIPICPTNERPGTSGKLIGCPKGVEPYAQDCSMDSDGDLSIRVIGGASGGPFVSNDGYLAGVLVRYHGCATIDKIRRFLKREGFAWLYEDGGKRTVSKAAAHPKQKSAEEELEEALNDPEIIKGLEEILEELKKLRETQRALWEKRLKERE